MGHFKELSIEEQEKMAKEEESSSKEEKPLTQEEIDEMVRGFEEEEEEEIEEDVICLMCGEHTEYSSLHGTLCCGAAKYGSVTYDWSGADE